MNSSSNICYNAPDIMLFGLPTGNWQEDNFVSIQPRSDPFAILRHFDIHSLAQFISLGIETITTKTWEYDKYSYNVTTSDQKALFIKNLGWSFDEALETRMRLRAFEEDWNCAGMEAYDEL